MDLHKKQIAFNTAMNKYHQHKSYATIYKLTSILNVSMQFYLFIFLFTLDMNVYIFVAVFIWAYFLTDFINGYVHMYMDNNDRYNSIVGPFICSFHLHHRNPNYNDASIVEVYFSESGSKFWLVPYLMLTIYMGFLNLNPYLMATSILVGILSSVAEVSHFLSHNSSHVIVKTLQKMKILLSLDTHIKHHQSDNKSYAFLNGMSDFILDRIAQKMYHGYKNYSDLHAQTYEGKDTNK